MIKKIFDWSLNKWILSLFVLICSINAYAAEKTFVVTNTKDSGEGSLRAAIEAVNKESGEDSYVITFDISGGSKIQIDSALFLRQNSVTIDGSGSYNLTIVGDNETSDNEESFNGLFVSCSDNVTIKNLTVTNCNIGIRLLFSKVLVDNCKIYDNNVGVEAASGSATITNCVISGNSDKGVYLSYMMCGGDCKGCVINCDGTTCTHVVDNNIIGLTADGRKKMPNGDGIRVFDAQCLISNNVISGNAKNGINLQTSSKAEVYGNYIGTNKQFADLGNGINGIRINGSSSSHEIGSERDEDANIIGFNAEYGLYSEAHARISRNYVGVANDYKTAIPNGMGGVYVSFNSAYIKGLVAGFNNGNGVRVEKTCYAIECELGGNGKYSFPNEEYGLYCEGAATLTDCKIFDNKRGGFNSVYSSSTYGTFIGNRNLFGGENQPFAITQYSRINVPTIKSAERVGNEIVVKGSVAYLSNNPYEGNQWYHVSTDSIGIELFLNNGADETALCFAGTATADENGDWTCKVPFSLFVQNGMKSVTAAATHYVVGPPTQYSDHSIVRATSALAESFNVKDFGYDLTKKEYYVKTNGVGDGSTWDDAMSPEAFAFVLPQVADGVTFYVAEGRYMPVSKDEKGDYFQYNMNSSVKISGGYPKDSKGTEKNYNPAKYQTVFTGDPSGDDYNEFQTRGYKTIDPSEDDIEISCLFMLDNKEAAVDIEGCVMKACTYYLNEYHPSYVAGVFSGRESGDVGHLNLKDCVFDVIGGFHIKEFNAESCVFRNQPTTSSPSSFLCANTADFSKCSFKGMIGLSGGNFARVNSIKVANCLFDSLLSSSVIFDVKEQYIYNNTFVNLIADGTSQYLFPAVSTYKKNVEVVGNMFVNCKYQNLVEGDDNAMVKNNLCVGGLKGTALDIETNDDPNTLLDGVLNAETGRFDINYSGNGVVKGSRLLTTTLSDGTSIRFPLNETKVVDDQYDESRLLNTCVGAYEMECPKDTTFVRDTVEIGGEFLGEVYSNFGVYDSIPENLQTAAGCDSVVMHTLYVKPSSTNLNYYVKTKRVGKGDGSDWDNAMNGDDFSACLPLAPKGAIFYVAAGTYRPIYDLNVTVPEVLSSCQYTINNDVIIRGGYPSDATGKYDLSEPDKYVTLFDGENLGTVFFAFSNAKNVTFDGISIDKSNGYGFQRYVEDADSLLILNSVFSKCEGTAVFEINPSKFAGIMNTVFSNNESSIYFGNVTSAEIKGSSFVENKGYLLVAQSIADGASLKIDSTSFIDNVGNLRMSGKVSVEITNSSFDNSSGHYDGSSNPISIRNSKIENSKGNWLLSSAPTIYVDSCIFNKNNTYVINALSSNLSFHNSVVTESDTFPIFNVKDCDIQKSTFYNNGHQYVDATPMITSSSVKVENSTFSNNKSGYGIFYAGDVTLNNNTILGVRKDIVYGSLANSRLTGNIILYNDSVDMSGGSVIIANGGHDKEFFSAISLFKNNVVFGNKTIYSIEMESNYFVNELEIDKLLEGSYTKGLQIFTPDIKDNGGFTPTVALLDDKLADGTSIRFPIKETNVTVDQRGFVRLDETCMGAYEIVCTGDTTFVRDTILCGESFKDSVFTQVGRHELFETFTDRYDCDSVVKYTLFVKPTGLNYYVKTKRVGKGDGSDWDNAMNGDDFAACLPLAPKGATFYVAEGTYKPIYDAKLDEPSKSSNRQYTINNDVTIRGGYSDNATGTVAPSNPKVNKTIFDGDILDDDVKSESKGTDGYVKLTLDKREDNAFSLFQTLSNDDLHIAFDGVCVRNSNYGLNILNSGKNLKISNSEFSYNNTSVNLPYQRDELEVYNSEFSKNVSSVINMPQAYKLTMDSVLFENNQHRIIDIPTQSGINPDHEVRLNRIFAYSNGDSSAIINSIGHDFELKNSEFKNNHGLLYLLDNTRIDSTVFEKNYGDITKYGELGFDINECTFVDNKAQGTYIYTAKNGSSTNHFSITKSSFVNTDSKGLLYAVTDSINIDSSLFSGSSHATIDMINYKTANVSRSYFSENENANLQFTGLTARLYGNTFWKNKSNNERETSNLFDFNSTSEPVLIANNTLVSNVSSDLIELHGCSPEMLNNTILGNINTSYVIAAYPGDLKMEGNIVLGNTVDSKEGLSNIGTEVIYSRWSNIEYKNNILPCIVDRGDVFINEIDQSIINNNIFSIFDNTNAPEELKEVSNSNEDILTSLFDGEYDSNTGLFTPVLTDKGVLTPVVVLKKETLSDGTFVRFPRLDKVTEDQRVESRFDFSCMGAYEMTCEKPFKAEGEVLNESTCHGQYGGKRAVVKIYDEDGEPSEGKFTFINKAFSPKIEDKNIEIYDKGVFVLHNAGKPLDTLIISNDLCTQKIGLTPYQSSDSEKTANIKGVESKDQTCYGVNNGSVQFEYSDFHSFYDLSFRLESFENGYYTTKEMRLSEGVVTFDSVPAGKYKAFVLLAVEGCVMIDVDTLFVDSVEIKAPQDPMNILEVSTSDNHCNTLYDGIAEFKVSGWSMDEGWSWKYLIANEDTITKTEAEQVSKDTFDISIHGLKGAKYKFVLSDVCGQSIDTAFIVTDNIPEPVKIEKSVVGYTCPSVFDGKITYTVTNWDNSFVALMNEDTILPKTVVKNVASFVADSLSDSLCVLTIVNMCNEEMSDTTDLFTYSLEHEGFTITNVLFDSEKAKCDINARILDVTVKGGHKNIYDFCVMTVAGDTVEHVILDSTHFISNTLPDGQFMIVASIPEGCSSGYDKDLVVKPTVKLTARKTEAECGDKKSTLILVNADSPEYQSKLYLLNEKGVWVETDSILSGGYKKTLTESLTTVYTAIKSTTAECSLFAPIENYHEENILSNSEFKTDVKTVDQHCFNVKNGELDLVYSGFDSEYDLVLVAVNKDTKEEFVSKEMTKDTIFLTDLDSGLYDVSIRLAIGGCALEGAEKPLGQYHIEGVDSMLKIVKDSVSQSKCYSNFVATATIYFKNWQKDIYSWNYYLDDEFRYNGKPEEMGIDTSITIFADRGGLAKFAIFDVCKDTLKRKFVIDSLEKPSVQILVDSSYVDLKCAYDSGCVVVKLKGGNRDSSRFFLEYQNPSNVNFFGLVPADTMFKIYDFIEGKADTTSSYTPNLKENVVCRLDSGTYTVVYQNLDTIGCKGDYSLDRIKITRPAPVYLKLATNEVRCFDKAEGVVNFIPERLGRAWEKYTLANDSDKTTGSNWAKWLFLDDEAQYKKYRLGRSNKDEAHYYSGHVSDSLPYRSNVFYEIAKIAITAKNQDSTVLMKHLAQDSARIPLPAMRNKGDYESVPTDWIGFNTLYADTYYVAVTDTFGCIYVDSFSVEGPKDKKLEIVSVIPPTADSNCDANKRRITFTAAGGWGDYIFSVKNLDDPNSNSDVPIEDLPEDKFYGGLLDVDYVQDVKYDTIYDSENKRNQVRYRSRILNPGRHVVSVFDKEFCYATADTILIKADYTMDGKKIFDWCGDPDNNRLIPVVTSSNGSYAQIDSFTVRIGHATIKKDSVEYRYKQKWQTIIDENNNKTSGLGNLPMGKIGVIAYVGDGCSAFNEFTYERRDGFVPLKIVAKEFYANKCYDDSTGIVFIDLGGGNEMYTKFELDGKDVYSNYDYFYYMSSLVTLDKDNDGVTDSSYIQSTEPLGIPNFVNNKDIFKKFNAKYTPRSVIEKWAYSNLGENPTYTDSLNAYNKLWNSVKNDSNYVIRFNDLPWGNFLAKDSMHYLVAEDIKGCVDTLKFIIPHPDKLEIEVASSPVCPDGAGRLFAKSSKGGVPPYSWAIDDYSISEYDRLFPIDNPNKIVPKKPTNEGFKDFNGYSDFKDYYTGFQPSDHIPAMEGNVHYMYIKDSHECVAKSKEAKVDKKLTWDEISQDFIVSTWHSYGDVLVIIDKTDYENLKVAADNSKYAYTYDSMHVEVVLKSPENQYLKALPQMKELYTYGIPENNNVNSDENQEEMTVDWRGTTYVGPMWGVPAEVAVTVRTDEEYDKVAEQFNVELGSLKGKISGLEYQILVCDSIINHEGKYFNVSGSKVQDATNRKYEYQKEIKTLEDSIKNAYGPEFDYTNTICNISQIKQAFSPLVPEKDALRMSFIKLEPTDKAGNDYVKDMLSKKGKLPFYIRTTAYVDGCDITTEHNLYLTFDDSIPYPIPNYKETLTLLPTPNPATNGYCTVRATVNKKLDSTNELYYYLTEADGKIVIAPTKLDGISPVETIIKYEDNSNDSNNSNSFEYSYDIPVYGLETGKEYIFVATTKNRVESAKILTK